jgi:DNA polymerase III subunit epsilon
MRLHNLAFVDTETTGLDSKKHEIIEIGVVIVSQDFSDPSILNLVEEFDIKIKPERISDADPQALKINHYDPSQWKEAITLSEAMKIFSEKTKDTIMVCHNTPFDASFLSEAFNKTGIKNQMHYHTLDTISIAYAKLSNQKDVDKFSLRVLSEHFGIENKKSHSALSDAKTTFLLYKKLMEM